MSKVRHHADQYHGRHGIRRRIQSGAFRILYRFGGPIYDRFVLTLFGDAWNRWRLSALDFVEEGPVLDLGSGTGVLVEAAAKRGFSVLGIEREPSMLRAASGRRVARGRLVRADATRLPVTSNSVGSCVSTFPAGFILQTETLDEVARVLKPGAMFVVLMGGETTESSWWRSPIRLLLRLFYGASSNRSLPDGSLLHHALLPGEWRRIEAGSDRTLVWLARRDG